MSMMAHHHTPPILTRAHHHHQGQRQPTTTHQRRRRPSTTPHQQRTRPTTRHLTAPWSLRRIHSPRCLLVSSSCVLSSSLICVHRTHIPLLLVTRECMLFRECVLSSSFIHVQYTDTNLCLLIFSRKCVLLSSLIPRWSYSHPSLPCLRFVCCFILPRPCSLYSHAPFVSSSVIGVCFRLPSSAPILPHPCLPYSPKFSLSQVGSSSVLPHPCSPYSHAPFVSSSVIGVCFHLPSSVFAVLTP